MAAGQGTRFGGQKQYEALGGRRVLDWSLAAARSVAQAVVLVVPPAQVDRREPRADVVVAGGASRSASVRAGLAAVPASVDLVLVHDAVRPLATPALFAAVVAAVEAGADAAVPALPLADTVKRVDGDLVVETVDRRALVVVQTPQAFRAEVLRAAHARGGDATDDAALVEQAGGAVKVVPGERHNVKLTTRDDLDVARLLVDTQRCPPAR